MDALGRRIVETLKQGKEYEYGFLGISLDARTARTGSMSAQPGTPAGEGGVLVDDEILAVGDIPVADADSLVLAINAMPAGDAGQAQDPPPGQGRSSGRSSWPSSASTGEVIATNRPAPWRGLRVDYTSTLPNATFGAEILEAPWRAAAWSSPRSSRARRPTAPASRRARSSARSTGKRVRSPRDFAKAVAEPQGPRQPGDRPGAGDRSR